MNPVAGAGATLGGFLLAHGVETLAEKANSGWAEATKQAEFRIANFRKYVQMKEALMDVAGVTAEQADGLADLYSKSETVRVAVQNLNFRVYGSPKPKDQVPFGQGRSMAEIKAMHQQVLARFGALGIAPKHPPLHRDMEAAQAVLDSVRLAEEAAAEKERQDAARAEAVRQDILKRQAESEAKWAKRAGFVKGLFGFGNRSKSEPEPAAKPASNTNTGHRPE